VIRRHGTVTGAALSLALVGLLALGLVVQTALSAGAAQLATGRTAVLPTAIPLSTFAAIGLPSDPAQIVALRVRVPAGVHFTHQATNVARRDHGQCAWHARSVMSARRALLAG
jgi:hypothetical protein